jgi:two-component system catabolic regulation response regulator CreB
MTRVLLVVEDDPAIRALCRETLERVQGGLLRGIRFVDAANLVDARRLIQTEKPDILMMDVRLPDGNGLDLIREVRRTPSSAQPKVIVASASVLPAERDTALAAGADVFLPKPYRLADLVGAIVEQLVALDSMGLSPST